MLRKLVVRNFKSLDEVSFTFEAINLFVGPNSSGKSTALQAIEVLHALLHPSISEHFEKDKGWDYRDIPHRKNLKSTMSWQAEYHLELKPGRPPSVYWYEVELQPRLHLGIGRESLSVQHPGGAKLNLIERTGRQTKILDEKSQRFETTKLYDRPCSAMVGLKERNGSLTSIFAFKRFMERFQSFLLWNPKDLRKPHQGLAERLGPSGEHLPGFWAHLQRKEPEKAKELLAYLTRFFPKIQSIQSSGKAGWAWHHLNVSERIGDRVIHYPAEQASDGFLRLLAVFSLKFLPDPPLTLTLEEPENGVHPHLISAVVTHLKGLTERKSPGKIQVFITSHSPYVLSEFIDRPECVQIFEKGLQDSVPHVTKLSDRPQLTKAAEALNHSLGDLWYSNILGGGMR